MQDILVSGALDNKIMWWDYLDRKEVARQMLYCEISCLKTSPVLPLVVAGLSDGVVHIYDSTVSESPRLVWQCACDYCAAQI